MKEPHLICPRCRHRFHARARCTAFDFGFGLECSCEGIRYDATKEVSGFCYIMVGETPDSERALHAACPGVDYVYPCQCECHSSV